jgi:outer membrane protein TolC
MRATADAIRSLTALIGRAASAESALAHSREAYRLAKERYENGLSDYQSVLTAEDILLQAQLTDAGIHVRGYTLDVALVKALGGGYDAHSTFATQVKP